MKLLRINWYAQFVYAVIYVLFKYIMLVYVLQKEGGTTSSILLREAVLEEQLERAHATIVTLKHDKNALKLSIRELQTRLTNAQVHKKNGGDDAKSQTAASVQEAMQRGEREKDLEKQLIKAKKDKDKSLKLLIQLIGKVVDAV